ncbi:helix-turn-helix domain-containing protein [Herbaspirillum chlorophenolicum]|uniref:Helix-turn-helix domain-containing protein n=1 Tax=Herbaspirillum chlorophenolicum TaxID=211589 RepID=A0ABW8F5F6_9BURK
MQYENELNFDLGYSRMYSSPMVMTIGQRLDQAMREARFPSQSALSRASGVPQPTINRILKGAGARGPETETLKKLAVACNVSFEWLNEGIEAKGRRPKDNLALLKFQAEPNKENHKLAEEMVELITLFKDLEPEQRQMVLRATKLAAKRLRNTELGTAED